jgi:hypothetical protein
MSKRSYKIFALATLPFFVVDYWYTCVDPVVTPFGGIVDGLGNVIIVSACMWGAQMEEKLD